MTEGGRLWRGGPTQDQFWSWVGSAGLQILVTIAAAVVLRWVLVRVIDRVVRDTVERGNRSTPSAGGRVLAAAAGMTDARHEQRTRTVGSLLRSIVTVVIATVALLTIMSVVGIPMGPMLASAGIGGIAIGLGAQSLIKDFLAGIFLIFEDQYGVGDLVTIGAVTGTVEDVGLRVTRLRDPSGAVWYIRNGEIVQVSNVSQGWSTAIVDVQVSPEADLDRAEDAVRSAVAGMNDDPAWADVLTEEPRVLGIEQISATGVSIRVMATCATDKQWGVQREIRRRAKEALDAAGIPGPVWQPTTGPGDSAAPTA